jgi:Fic family protein
LGWAGNRNRHSSSVLKNNEKHEPHIPAVLYSTRKMNSYTPPFTLNAEILGYVARICEVVGCLSASDEVASILRLRRVNRIRTIQGSLAIEGNTLTEGQITAILEGKQVLAPPREVQEVKNALSAYEHFSQWRPEKEVDLLEAHRLLMNGLIDDAGEYRAGGVGVMSGGSVIHMAPPAGRVHQLMADLLGWLSIATIHPLISSSVFHYEFEFIHPFSDGNGRMGRLWQSLILAKWNPVFACLPVESLVFERQEAYYRALQESTRHSDSAPFIHFMLIALHDALVSAVPQVAPQVTPQVLELLQLVKTDSSRAELQALMGLRDRKSFFERYLRPALSLGLLEMSIPEKPNSRLQKYRLTGKGRQAKLSCGE